ncbi:MAG: single-stranded DNA-binding protein [Candidatus Nanoperiomorbaceae bacterium]
MASFSNVVLMGNITRDLEQRTTPSGAKVLDVNIAVNTYRKGAENNQITTFYRGTIFGDRGDVIARNFKKGDPILLSGRDLVVREWESNGRSGYSVEFTIDNFSFVSSRGGNNSSDGATSTVQNEQPPAKDDGVDTEPIDLSDIPF